MAADSPRPRPPPIDSSWALFLDVDGTLIDFAPHPDAVRVPDRLPGLLRALHRRLGGALALVSGRSLEALDALLAPLRLSAAGLHGLELRNGDATRRSPPAPEALERVLAEARAFIAQRPGAIIEDKGSSIGLHWRGAPRHAAALTAFAEAAVQRLPGYRLQHGNQVVELRPAGANKGDAIAALAAEPPFLGRHPVFVGDDLTDEHGFAAVNARDGTSILVGTREPSAARHGLTDTAAVLSWLEQGARP